jgi:hypothetical protein
MSEYSCIDKCLDGNRTGPKKSRDPTRPGVFSSFEGDEWNGIGDVHATALLVQV